MFGFGGHGKLSSLLRHYVSDKNSTILCSYFFLLWRIKTNSCHHFSLVLPYVIRSSLFLLILFSVILYLYLLWQFPYIKHGQQSNLYMVNNNIKKQTKKRCADNSSASR